MFHRPLARAIALSLGMLLACAGGAAADTFPAVGDGLMPPTLDIGQVAPGAEVTVDVAFVLTCSGFAHMDPGQTITAGIDSAVAPLGGAVVSVTDGTVGPVPGDWPAEGADCPLPIPTFATGTPSVVTLRAPTTPGMDYVYSLRYHRSFAPFGVNDAGAIRQATVIDIVLDVVVNTPPTLTPPTVAGGVLEGNSIGGWIGPWLGLAATDTEDDPDPTPTCSPAAGMLIALGTTSVTCTVTDSAGLTDSATFDVTVVDTTAPTLLSVPEDQNITTGDPTGTTLSYATPSAFDLVDTHLAVGCLPTSGTHIGVGTTTVACTATDGSGNTAQESFDVTVMYVAPHMASASWGEPVAGPGSTFTANRGRTVPVKVELFVDGLVRTSGQAQLNLTPCGGGSAITLALTYGGGRWDAALDTSDLAGSCYTVAATIDGLAAGAFRLELRGAEPVKANVKAEAVRTGNVKTGNEKASNAKAEPVKSGNDKTGNGKTGNGKP